MPIPCPPRLRRAVLSLLSLAAAALVPAAAAGCSGATSDAQASEDALVSGTVNGHTLTASEAKWMQFVADHVVPRLPGSRDEQLTVASRAAWWSLKEGTFDARNPPAYSNCHSGSDHEIDPTDVCDSDHLNGSGEARGQAWQVGLAAVQVPMEGHSVEALEALARDVLPGMTIDQVLAEAASDARLGADDAQAVVASDGLLRISWLLRHSVIGFVAVERDEVTPECIDRTTSGCFGTGWDETRRYAPSRQAALRSIADIRAMLDAAARSGGGAGGGAGGGGQVDPPADGGAGGTGAPCYSPTLGDDVDEGVCVQSAASGRWFQCVAGAWQASTSASGQLGACTDTYPL